MLVLIQQDQNYFNKIKNILLSVQSNFFQPTKELISWQIDLVRVDLVAIDLVRIDLVAIDLVRIDLVRGSRYYLVSWILKLNVI